LRDDTEIIFNGQDFGCTRAKDCLTIGQNDLEHCIDTAQLPSAAIFKSSTLPGEGTRGRTK
jgi:hypothetical protein